MKPSRKWSKHVSSLVLLLISVFSLLAKIEAAQTTDPKEAASSSYGTVQGRIGSEDSLNKNAMEPLTSGTSLYTFDKSKSSTSQILCPSSKKFVEVFIQPSGTGDITYIVISQDTNLDGTTDYTTSSNVPISGVCANGVISCNLGTWDNCVYYKWQADSAGKISVVAGSLSNLSSCYCINRSCGSNLVWTNLATVLEDIGGGIVGALNQVLPQTAVSKSQLSHQIDGTSIVFYGQDQTGCNVQQAGTGSTSPQNYFENDPAFRSAGENVAISDLTDPNSLYSILMSSPAATGTIADRRSCRIVRGGSVNRQTTSVSGNGSYSNFCTDHWVYDRYELVTDANGNKHVKFFVLDTDPSGSSFHWNCSGRNTDLQIDTGGWHLLRDVDIPDTMENIVVSLCIDVTSAPSGDCLGWEGGYGCFSGTANGVSGQGSAPVECPGTGGQFISFSYTYSIEGVVEDFINQIHNGCERLESDSGCTLWDEVVDGVQTIDNGASTGLIPEPICKTVKGVTKSQIICDWWVKERVYMCNSSQVQYDFSDAKQRVGKIKSTTQDLGTEMYYEDMRKTGLGGWVTESHTVRLPERGTYENCEKACKVRRLKQDTQVTSRAGNASTVVKDRADNTTYEILYNTCSISPLDNQYHCPTAPGDEILIDCSCVNDFDQAAVAVQFLRLAAQDLICSDNDPKPLQ